MKEFWKWYKNAVSLYGAYKDKRKSIRVKNKANKGVCYCPIVGACYAKTGIRYRNWEFEEAAKELGLTSDQARKIAHAADRTMLDGKKLDKLRERLLLVARES